MSNPIKFFMDEHVPASVTKELLRLGFDVLTVQAADMCGEKDPVLLAFAASKGRILVTQNAKGFVPLHRAGTPHTGIAIAGPYAKPETYAKALILTAEATTPEFWVSRLEYIDSLA